VKLIIFIKETNYEVRSQDIVVSIEMIDNFSMYFVPLKNRITSDLNNNLNLSSQIIQWTMSSTYKKSKIYDSGKY